MKYHYVVRTSIPYLSTGMVASNEEEVSFGGGTAYAWRKRDYATELTDETFILNGKKFLRGSSDLFFPIAEETKVIRLIQPLSVELKDWHKAFIAGAKEGQLCRGGIAFDGCVVTVEAQSELVVEGGGVARSTPLSAQYFEGHWRRAVKLSCDKGVIFVWSRQYDQIFTARNVVGRTFQVSSLHTHDPDTRIRYYRWKFDPII